MTPRRVLLMIGLASVVLVRPAVAATPPVTVYCSALAQWCELMRQTFEELSNMARQPFALLKNAEYGYDPGGETRRIAEALPRIRGAMRKALPPSAHGSIEENVRAYSSSLGDYILDTGQNAKLMACGSGQHFADGQL